MDLTIQRKNRQVPEYLFVLILKKLPYYYWILLILCIKSYSKKQIFNINHSYKSYIDIYLSKNNVLIEIPINNKAKIFFNNCCGISWANFAPKYPLITNAKAKIKEAFISTLPAL